MNVAKIEQHGPHRRPARAAGLSVVTPVAAAERALSLHLEARRVSLEHLAALQASIEATQALAQAVVDAGDLYAPGLGAFAARFGEQLVRDGKALEALTLRQRDAAAAH